MSIVSDDGDGWIPLPLFEEAGLLVEEAAEVVDSVGVGDHLYDIDEL